MIGDTDGVLSEGGVVVGVGMGGGLAKTLEIVFGDGVRIGAEGAERKSGFHRFESEGIDFDGIEEVLATLLAGEEVVDPGEKRVAAELEGMAAGIEAESFGKVEAVLASGAGEQVGTADGVHDGGDLDEGVGGVGVGLLQVAGELGTEVADQARG